MFLGPVADVESHPGPTAHVEQLLGPVPDVEPQPDPFGPITNVEWQPYPLEVYAGICFEFGLQGDGD